MAERALSRAAAVLLLAYAAFALRAFLGDGLPLFFDAHSHLTRAWLAASALAAGDFPSWSFAWYGGYRLFEFYPPGYHLATGALGLLFADFALATKAVLFAGQLGAVLACFGLLRRLGAGPLVALFGALLFLHDPGRWRLLAVIGNHPSVFVYLGGPLLLLAVTRAGVTPRAHVRLFAAAALLLTGMASAHLTTSAHVLPALAAFACVHLVQRRPRAAARRALGALAAAGVAAVAATAWLSVPMARGLPLVSLGLESPALGFHPEPLAIALGLRPGSFRWIFVATPGLLACALAAGAAALSLHPAHARWRPAAAGLAASLASIAVLGERAALGVALFVALLAAAALETASAALRRRAGPRAALAAPALAIGALLAVQAGREQAPLRYVAPEAFAVYARIPSGDFARTFDVTRADGSLDGLYGQSSFSPAWSGRAIPFGGFPQGAPLATNVQAALAGRLVQDLAAPRAALSAEALDWLHLLHVGWLVDRGTPPRLAGRGGGSAGPAAPGLLRIAGAAPALFVPRLEVLSGEAPLARLLARWQHDPLEARGQRSLDALARPGTKRDFELFLPLLRQMRIERGAHRAERAFVVHGLAPPAAAEPAAAAAPAEFAVEAHREARAAVEIVARAGTSGFVRLAYAHDPELRVALDGTPVASVPDFLGAVVLAFPAGRHTLTLAAPPATVRLRLAALCGAIAAALVLLWAAASFLPEKRAPRGELP